MSGDVPEHMTAGRGMLITAAYLCLTYDVVIGRHF